MKRRDEEEDDLVQRVEEKVGHPWHKNIFERIPLDDVYKLKAAGFSHRQIGKYYGVCPASIARRLNHESW